MSNNSWHRYRKDVEEHGSTHHGAGQIPDLGTFTTPRIFQLAVEDQKGTPEESVKHEITTRTRSKAMPTGEVDSRALITASTSDGEDSPSQLTTEPKKEAIQGSGRTEFEVGTPEKILFERGRCLYAWRLKLNLSEVDVITMYLYNSPFSNVYL
jgi:hypothetical protein